MPVNGIGSNGSVADNSVSRVSSGNDAEFAGILSASKSTSSADLESIFEAASKKYNIPLNLLKAVAREESNFHPNAVSRCGAMGIMQLMPRTAKSLGVTDAFDPEQNIMGGAKYLREMLDEFGGNTQMALAAYNAGPGTVRKYGGVPSFAQGYVNKVLGYAGDDFSSAISKASAGLSAAQAGALPQTISAGSDAGLLSSKLISSMVQMWLTEKMDQSQDQFLQNLDKT